MVLSRRCRHSHSHPVSVNECLDRVNSLRVEFTYSTYMEIHVYSTVAERVGKVDPNPDKQRHTYTCSHINKTQDEKCIEK